MIFSCGLGSNTDTASGLTWNYCKCTAYDCAALQLVLNCPVIKLAVTRDAELMEISQKYDVFSQLKYEDIW